MSARQTPAQLAEQAGASGQVMSEPTHDLAALETAALAAEARVAELSAALADIQEALVMQKAAARKARGNWHLANIYRLIGD